MLIARHHHHCVVRSRMFERKQAPQGRQTRDEPTICELVVHGRRGLQTHVLWFFGNVGVGEGVLRKKALSKVWASFYCVIISISCYNG
jgi:hypothetical protein